MDASAPDPDPAQAHDEQVEPQPPGPSPDAPTRQPLDPQRLLRIAGLTREVLEEARRIGPEPGAVGHLRDVHGQITKELKEALPAELYEELDELTPEIRNGTLEELALAHAEILGWLEGLFQGTQLAIQFQAAQAAHLALQDRMRRGLPSPDPDQPDSRYL